MPHLRSVRKLRVKDFLVDLLEAFATGGVSLFKGRAPKSLRDIPFKLIFEIGQTISQLATAETMNERRPLIHQLANETELIGKHAEDIFILLNCPSQLKLDFKRAAKRMRSRDLDSQLATMDALFQALAWDDPDKRRPQIKRYSDGTLAVTPAARVPAPRWPSPRNLLRAMVLAIPTAALMAYVWGLMGSEQNRYLADNYFVSWAAWFGLIFGGYIAVVLQEQFVKPVLRKTYDPPQGQ